MGKMFIDHHKFSKSIYDMELHEELIAEEQTESFGGGFSEFKCLPLRVLRVSGGWLYFNTYIGGTNGAFVPFDAEYYAYKRKKRAISAAEISEGGGH